MRVFLRVMLVVVLIAAIGAVGYGIWDAGYQQALVESADANVEVVVATGYPGYGGFGFIFKALFVFLLFGLLFKFILGWRRWGPRRLGSGGRSGSHDYRSRMKDHLADWHDQAHGKAPSSEPEEPVSPAS